MASLAPPIKLGLIFLICSLRLNQMTGLFNKNKREAIMKIKFLRTLGYAGGLLLLTASMSTINAMNFENPRGLRKTRAVPPLQILPLQIDP